MKRPKLCVNTQTPLVRFNITEEELAKRYEGFTGPLDLRLLTEEKDYSFSPGGVTRMVFPLLTHMLNGGLIDGAHWVSLNPTGPEEVVVEGIFLHHIRLEPEKIKGYGYTKEAIWKMIHGIEPSGAEQGVLWKDEFADYAYYNRVTAERLLSLDKAFDFDLFYIHDFQQLAVGYMLHTLKPKVFRWHIPFDESMIPQEWREFLTTCFNSYDAIIVSCRRYLDDLKRFGYDGESRYVYPYIDPSPYVKPEPQVVERFCRRFHIKEEDKVILVVARLDPMKGQDRVIKALPQILKEVPNVKVVFIGNGSFSSSKAGIGLSKAELWLKELRALARRLKVQRHVVFTGHVSQKELNAAYERCDLTVLPSILEGFGLVVIESWLFHKPTVVTNRAGIAEMIEDGRNGLLFDPNDPLHLAEIISELLIDSKRARFIAENGFTSSDNFLIERGVEMEAKIIKELV